MHVFAVDTMHGALVGSGYYMRENFDAHAPFLTPLALLTSAAAMANGERALLAAGEPQGGRYAVRLGTAKLAVYYPILLRWREIRAFARSESLHWPLEESREAALAWFLGFGRALQPLPLTHLNEGGSHDLAWFNETVMNGTTWRQD